MCSSLRFTTSTEAPNRFCTAAAKGLPVRPPVNQPFPHLTQVGLALVERRQSPSPVSDVGGGHVDHMGQALGVHRDVTLDSGHLLARVIVLVLGAVRILYALGVHDAEAGLLFPTIAPSGRAIRFLTPAPKWPLSPGRAANSIAGNNCSKCANRDRRQVLRKLLTCGLASLGRLSPNPPRTGAGR